tara:strand:+ start:192 stop:383 length:192 start_codon:yes stop_codon:yes gene_type:complete
MITGIIIYLLIGCFCIYHIAGRDVKKEPDTFKDRAESIECMGLQVIIGFVLLWPFGLDFIFLD